MKGIGKHFLIGAVIGLIIVLFVLFTKGKVNADNLKSILFPVLLVSLAGGIGSLAFAINNAEKYKVKWQKSLALTINMLIYTILIVVALSVGMKGLI